MPAQPLRVKIAALDATILAAAKNFSGGKIPGVKGPIINGIILDLDRLGTLKPKAIAKEITASIQPGPGVKLTPAVTPLDDRRIIVGFKVQTRLG